MGYIGCSCINQVFCFLCCIVYAEIDSIKHQLAALKVLRPKVAALRASEGVAEAVVASTVEVDATAELEVQPEEEGAEMSTD